MKSKKTYFCACFLFGLIFISVKLNGGVMENKFIVFEPLLDKVWEGEMYGGKVTWTMELILNKKMIKKKLSFDGNNFKSETIIYWDCVKEELSYLRVCNNGHILQGKIFMENDMIVFQGIQKRECKNFTYKRTLEICADGSVRDIWHDDKGVGHDIKFTVKK